MNKVTYLTWYEFKEDLQKEVGHSILNREWLAIKPKEPLPWNESTMRSILSDLSCTKRENCQNKEL
jgi:hypothetical protein